MERPCGGTLDAIKYCTQKYPDVNTQSQWIKNGLITILLRDNGDLVKTIKGKWNEYDVLLRMWPEDNLIFLYYELYKGGGYIENGIEVISIDSQKAIDYNHSTIVFSCGNIVNKPIIGDFVKQNE